MDNTAGSRASPKSQTMEINPLSNLFRLAKLFNIDKKCNFVALSLFQRFTVKF
jgi:hypothetical protein